MGLPVADGIDMCAHVSVAKLPVTMASNVWPTCHSRSVYPSAAASLVPTSNHSRLRQQLHRLWIIAPIEILDQRALEQWLVRNRM